jgi:hypothetical protein
MPSKKEIRKAQAKISRDTLSDSYIISLLRKLLMYPGDKDGLTTADIRKRPELIKLKRAQIMMWRAIKAKKDEKHE